jgi:hypothetical protein
MRYCRTALWQARRVWHAVCPSWPVCGVDVDADVDVEATTRAQEPTPIQRQALPIGLLNRDIIGIAETGVPCYHSPGKEDGGKYSSDNKPVVLPSALYVHTSSGAYWVP